MSNANPRPLPLEEQLHDKWKFAFYLMLLLAVVAAACLLPIDASAAKGLLIGGICGIIGHYRATRVAELTLSMKLVNPREIGDFFAAMKYVEVAGGRFYRPDVHKFLVFEAQNIHVGTRDRVYCISGPIYVMKKMQDKFDPGVGI
ncbi:MAG: hypothetical protein ACYC0F_16810 [Rhodanobacter sp.]